MDLTTAYCSSCGNTDREDTGNSYSGCCNEPVAHGSAADAARAGA